MNQMNKKKESSLEAELRELQDNPLSESELAQLINDLSDGFNTALYSLDLNDVAKKLSLANQEEVEKLQEGINVYKKALSDLADRAELVEYASRSWADKAKLPQKYFDELYSFRRKVQDALSSNEWPIRAGYQWRRIFGFEKLIEIAMPERITARVDAALSFNSSDEVVKEAVELCRIEAQLERLHEDAIVGKNGFANFQGSDESQKKDCQQWSAAYIKLENESSNLLLFFKESKYGHKLDSRYCELKVKESTTEEALNDLLRLYGPLAKLGDLTDHHPLIVQARRAKLMVPLCEEALKNIERFE